MVFDAFKAGRVIDAGEYTVTAEEIVNFATRYDPQYFHMDEDQACRSRWNGLIASGWHTCSIAMRLAVNSVLDNSESIGSPGVEYIKWPSPVRPGDTLRLTIRIIEQKLSRSRSTGIVVWRWILKNQSGATVLDLQATSLFAIDAEPPSASIWKR